jgi:hypothetical protein
MSTYLAAAEQFNFEAHDMVDEVLDFGQKIQFASTRRISVRRPDRASADIIGDLVDERVRYDGTSLTILDNRRHVYAVTDVPETIDRMLDYVAQRFGIAMPLADLLFSDPYAAVIGQVRLGRYVGLHEVQGTKCHHLAFRQDSVDWQIWIQKGDKPLPRKLVITYKASPGQPQYIVLLDKWDLSRQFADGAFALKAPERVKQVDFASLVGQPTGPEKTPAESAPEEDRRE